MRNGSTSTPRYVLGLDLGDVASALCLLERGREQPLERSQMPMEPEAARQVLAACPRGLVVMEAGTHSPWVSRLAAELGHEVLVANPRQLALISKCDRKTDRTDAETLARLARADRTLLRPVHHRDERLQRHLEVLRARDALVRARTLLVNHARGALKGFGVRVNASSCDTFPQALKEQAPRELRALLAPVAQAIARLSTQIAAYDRRVNELCREEHPETRRLQQVVGVGPVTSLAFVLTIADPNRFRSNRQVGAYLGLRPRSDQSGASNRQLGIAKSGNPLLRRLLVQCAHHILGPFGPDTNLRRFGLAMRERGAGNAKKRAVVAVARRLAVLLLRLWRTGAKYEPLYAAPTTPALPARAS
jgi:transposase